jgi:hypothetical protein
MPIELQWKEYILAAHTATFTPVSEIFMSRVITPDCHPKDGNGYVTTHPSDMRIMNLISFQFAAVISLSAADLWPNGSDIGKRGCQTIQLFATALPFFGTYL